MTIQPLSDHTARVLISTQTLHNAVSVIKELVDNALDAHAASISIEISSNTLDKLIVRDDGTGVGVEDRQMLCKRGCTSKITNLDDLAKLGGTFLGFRGTALASVAELSKSVTVITRVDGEQPATTLTFGSDGTLLSSASASHNVGTTVRVESFLTSVPVRKQDAEKNSTKILDQIKRLLYGYSLARPAVKLSLKVLKAKNDKFNWSFAACRQESPILAAASQVVGKTTAALCGSYSATLDEEVDDSATFKIVALMLKGETEDLTEYSNTGQFISIDGRPVSQDKGVVKELVKLYKAYLHNAIQGAGRIPSKPILIAHIRCPEGSYDVNVEPAKDVVLFHDPSKVIELAKKLFIDVYGELPVSRAGGRDGPIEARSHNEARSFDVLLARKAPVADVEVKDQPMSKVPQSLPTTSKAESLVSKFARAMRDVPTAGMTSQVSRDETDETFQKNRHTFASPNGSMSLTDDGDITQGAQINSISQPREDEEESYDPHSAVLNNPFIRAKLTATKTPTKPIRLFGSASHEARNVGAAASLASSPPVLPPTNSSNTLRESTHLPTPTTSPQTIDPYQNPGPPFPRRSRNNHEDADDIELVSGQLIPQRSDEQQGRLDLWMGRSAADARSPNSVEFFPNNHLGEAVSPASLLRKRTNPEGLGSHQRRFSATTQKPFKSPLKQSQSTLQHGERMSLAKPYQQKSSNLEGIADDMYGLTQPDADLQNILAFEWRKKALKQQQRAERQQPDTQNSKHVSHRPHVSSPTTDSTLHPPSPAQAPSSTTSSSILARTDFVTKFGGTEVEIPPSSQTSNPHRNRYLAALRNLESRDSNSTLASSEVQHSVNTGSVERGQIAMSKNDPRNYLIQIQKRNREAAQSHLHIKKVQSSKLPLETICAEEMKHELLAIPAHRFPPTEALLSMSQSLLVVDPYIKTGKVMTITWSPTSKDIEQWQEKLTTLVRQYYRAGSDTGVESGAAAAQPIPDFEIPLVRVIKAHMEASEVHEDMNTIAES